MNDTWLAELGKDGGPEDQRIREPPKTPRQFVCLSLIVDRRWTIQSLSQERKK